MKRTHMKSRITAMLLAIVMVLQLVPVMAQPSVAQAAATDEQKVIYSLGSNTAESLTAASIEKNGWAFNRDETTSSVLTRIDNNEYSWYQTYMNMGFEEGNAIAFDIDVKEEGEYMFSVVHCNIRDFGGRFNVYVDDEFVGYFDADTVGDSYASGTGILDYVFELNNKKLTQGTHTVKFQNAGGRSLCYFYLNQIVLTKIIDVEDIDFTTACGAADVESATVNDNRWAVNKELTGEKTLAGLSNAELTAEYANIPVANGESIAFDFKADEWGIFSITAIADELAGQGLVGNVFIDGEYAGDIDTGSATAQASRKYIKIVELDAGVHTIEFNAAIGKGDKVLRIRELDITPDTPSEETYVIGSRSATSLTDASVAKNGWALNRDETTSSVLTRIDNGDYSWYQTYMNMDLRNGNSIAFDIDVKKEGEYKLSIVHCNIRDYGGRFNVYLDGENMGTFDADSVGSGYASGTGVIEYVFELKNKKLSAGTHVVRFENIGGRSLCYFYLNKIILSPTEGAKYAHAVDFCVDKSSYSDVALDYYGWALDSEGTSDAVVSNAATVPGADGAVAALAAGEKVVFDINLLKGGNWKIDAVVKQLGAAGAKGIFAVDGKEIGRIDCSAGSGDADVKAGCATISKGKHKISFTAETAGKLHLKSLAFTPAEVEEYTVKFGSENGSSSMKTMDKFVNGYEINTSESSQSFVNNMDNDNNMPYEEHLKFQLFNKDDVAAFDFIVPFDGKYNLDLKILQTTIYSVRTDLYVDDTFIGEADLLNPNAASTPINKKLRSIELSTGKHTLYVKRTEADGERPERDEGYPNLYFYSLKMTPVEALPTVTGVELNVGKATIFKDETTEATAKIVMSDGSELELNGLKRDGTPDENNFLKVESSNPAAVKYENGVLTAVADGPAVITASAKVGGVAYSDTVNVRCVELSEELTFELVADKIFPIRTGKSQKVLLQGVVSGLITDLGKAQSITFGSTDESVATAVKVDTDKNVYAEITGHKAGNATITVTAQYDDNLSDTATIDVEVKDDYVAPSTQIVNFGLASYQEMNLKQHGVALNNKTDPVIIARENSKVETGQLLKVDLQKKGESLWLDFKVNADANYSVDMSGKSYGDFGFTGAFYIDGKYVGELDFSSPNLKTEYTLEDVNEHFRDIYLTKGTHTIEIRRIDDFKDRHQYMWLSSMTLKPVAEPAVAAGINVRSMRTDKFLLGDILDAEISVRMSDGQDYYMPGLTENQGKITVRGIKEDAASFENGKIYAKKPGEAVFGISAEITEGVLYAYWRPIVAEGMLYDFKRSEYTDPATATVENNGWTVDTTQTTINTRYDPNATNYNLRPVGFAGNFKHNEILALTIDVKKTGAYDVDMVASRIRELGMVGAFYIDDNYLGEFNFSHPDFKEEMTEAEMNALSDVQHVQFNSVYLEAGEHTLYVKRINSGSYRRDMFWIDRLVISNAVAMPTISKVEIISKSNKVKINADTQAGAEVWMSNGRLQHFGLKRDGSADNDNKVVFTSSDPNLFTVDAATGVMHGIKEGQATLTATATVGGVDVKSASKDFIVAFSGKLRRSYYTEEKVANARENIKKYSWARSQAETAIANADRYIDKIDWIYDNITSQELPRGIVVGFRNDPMQPYCRYCGYDLRANGGTVYDWVVDPINNPWKIKCPECRRSFPSNDFWSFYQLGIVSKEEYGTYKDINGVNIPIGQWSYDKSHYEHYMKFKDDYAAHPEIPITSFEEYNKLRKENKRLPGVGFLKNTQYPEVASVKTLNNGYGLYETENVDSWAVDDGYGYKTGRITTTANGKIEEAHTYISFYNRVWLNKFVNKNVIENSYLAYLYTGKAKYGRVAAILLDRIADVYPQMKIKPYFSSPWTGNSAYFFNSDSTSPYGRIEGCIWETEPVSRWILGYDAVWPVYEDEYVLNYLGDRSAKIGLSNPKNTPELVRDHIENNLIREIYKGIKDGDIYGNFGLHQTPTAQAAVVLDTEGETQEMLDYLFAKDESGWHAGGHTGGDVNHRLYNEVDRDGGTNEGLAPEYNNIWYTSIGNIADALNGYDGYKAADLYQNPKVQKMLENQIKLIMARRTSPSTADSGTTAGIYVHLPYNLRMIQCFAATGNKTIAQSLYFWNGNKVDGIKEDIFTKDPEKIQDKIQKIIDTEGEFPFDESNMYAGEGFATLRDGNWYGKGSTNEKDTQRDFWMIFSLKGNHGHPDVLNLGMHAYGLDFAPDLGYPTTADGSDEYMNWGHGSVNHNVVVVNDSKQASMLSPGKPLHFDDADRVKVMDVSAPDVYSVTDEYRRTVVMVDVNDDISYGVDFFRIIGGTNHLYSFHSQSHEATTNVDLKREEDTFPVSDEEKKAGRISNSYQGVYTGEIVPWKTYGYPTGYSYLFNVRRAVDPGVKEFEADFKVTDYRKILKDSKDLMLNVKMFNDFELDEITLTDGDNPYRGNNPEKFTYLFARRASENGEQLDSTFTTVFQPYKKTPYIASSERVTDIVRTDGKPVDSDGDVVRVIKVNLEDPAIENGARTDYIIYASNNEVEYEIEGKLVFQGFLGFATYNNDELRYTYLNDGVTLKDKGDTVCAIDAERNEYSASVINFTREPYDAETGKFIFNNEIVIRPYEEIALNEIKGRWMYIENDGISNGAYLIENARTVTDDDIARHEGAKSGDVLIELGNVTLIRSATDVTATTGNYAYNIAPNQYVSIPLAENRDTAPRIAPISDKRGVAGGKLTVEISATSPLDKELTLTAKDMPRGASFDPETRTVTWTPDNTQIGEHHFAIGASDGTLESTVHFIVTVHRSALSTGEAESGASGDQGSGSGSSGEAGANSGSGSGGASGGGGSGGGGGSSSGGDTGNTETGDNTDDNNGDVGDGVLDVPSEKFIDLGNHSWAKDAIYALVDAGVVNGTSENTYSPANNIKRADFAIMLVRAFGIKSGEGEHFADVDANKYYAKELLFAKVNGIVGGIGDNKFNPEGEITRQDMMLMLTRALDVQGIELEAADRQVLSQFADAANIAEYAADAVSRVVKAGIIAGAGDKLNPLAKATRAEIAVMLSRVLAK